MKTSIGNMSEEERRKNLEKAMIAREAKKEAGRHLRQQYADKNHHRGLASKHGVRLPRSYIPNTETKYLKRVIKAVGADGQTYLEECGVNSFKKLAELNPLMTACEEVGLFLEYWDERKKLQNQGVE